MHTTLTQSLVQDCTDAWEFKTQDAGGGEVSGEHADDCEYVAMSATRNRAPT